MAKKRKKKDKLVSTTGTLVTSGTMNVMGAHMVGEMPSTPATYGVQSGFKTMGRMHGPMAIVGTTGIVYGNLKKLQPKKKKKRR